MTSNNDIVNRIKQVMEHYSINSVAMANRLGYNSSEKISRLFRVDGAKPSYDIIFDISNMFEINVDWLVTGRGSMLKRDDIASDVTASYITNNDKGIPLIPITAFAGFGALTFEDLQIEHYYEVPEFKQADFLMRIKGNSMYPKYSSGDIVACAIIEETLFFQWNKIYAIYTKSQGVLVKRVKPSSIKDHIMLVSDNTQYDPFDVPISDISKLALIIGVIRVE